MENINSKNLNKIRTIITQDAEVDDQNSLRHFLLYANEVELQGIVQTSSKFHWIGVEGAVKPPKTHADDFEEIEQSGPFDKPYRWTGTDWMWKTIDDYEKDYVNLSKHAEGYPSAEYLRSITKIGNIGYEGEMEKPTDGSNLLKERILDDDPRTLYIQVWGGSNTLARALYDIEEEYKNTSEWGALHEKITKKVVVTACGEQDGTYRSYIAESWPQIQFVKTLQMKSYAYPWFVMPECESKDCLRSEFMQKYIINGKSKLSDGYRTWMDGVYYEGEIEESQFGSNENIVKDWFGARMGLPAPVKFDFLSEGDSPTFFLLFNWGFRTLEDFRYGGISGRYHMEDEYNSKGEKLNMWNVSLDKFTGRDGKEQELESMWKYVADLQRDFAARVDWCSKESFEDAEHAPSCTVDCSDYSVSAGETITINAFASSPDNSKVNLSFEVYKDASADCAKDVTISTCENTAKVAVPESAQPGDIIHVIVKAQAAGEYKLTHYAQVIITVK